MDIFRFLIYGVTFIGVGVFSWGAYPLLTNIFRRINKASGEDIDESVDKLEDMFIDVERKKITRLYLFAPLASGFIAFIFTKNLIFSLIGSVLGFLIPGLWIRFLQIRRKNKFSAQLVDGLMILSSSLKGGLSLIQAIDVLVTEMQPPISQEFSLILHRVRLGFSIEEALNKLKERMGSEEIRLLITAMSLAQQTGGNLPDVLGKLVGTIREKNRVAEKVKTLTVQAKIQGVIMSLLPVVFAFSVISMNKDFFKVMLETDLGKMLIVIAVTLQIIGIFLIKVLSKVEV